jgi:hypothetical protein
LAFRPTTCRKSVLKQENRKNSLTALSNLTKPKKKSVLQLVQDGFTSGKYVTQREILSFNEEHFQKTVTYGWLASFLERWEGIVIRTTVVPQGQLRPRISREYLNNYISLVKEYVPLVLAELIFNLD